MSLKKYVTLRDIADHAKVSVNTVSRALKNRSDIGKETKERIQKVAKEIGYVPHVAAAHLRGGGMKSIGVIVTHIDNPFFSRILQGISDCVTKQGYTMLILSSDEDVDKELRHIQVLSAYRVSGMLIAPANDLSRELDFARINVPHIQIVRPWKAKEAHYFISDTMQSGVLAAERFIAMGRKKMAYLGFDLATSCNNDRQVGFVKTLKKARLPFNENSLRTCESSSELAYEAMKTWINDGFNAEGLFVYNDMMAFGVLRALSDAGIRVPEDVSVIGHDDIEVASCFVPRLTTIQTPKHRLGYESAEALLKLIRTNKGDLMVKRLAQNVIYEPILLVRET